MRLKDIPLMLVLSLGLMFRIFLVIGIMAFFAKQEISIWIIRLIGITGIAFLIEYFINDVDWGCKDALISLKPTEGREK